MNSISLIGQPSSAQVDPIPSFNKRYYGDKIAARYDKAVERICDIYKELINLVVESEQNLNKTLEDLKTSGLDLKTDINLSFSVLSPLLKAEGKWVRKSSDYQNYLIFEKEDAFNNMNKLLDTYETKQHLRVSKVYEDKNKLDNLKKELDRCSKDHMARIASMSKRFQVKSDHKREKYRNLANKLIALYDRRIELTIQTIDNMAKAIDRKSFLVVSERFNLQRSALQEEIYTTICKRCSIEDLIEIDFKERQKNNKKSSELSDRINILDNQFSKDWDRIHTKLCNEDMESSEEEEELKGRGDANPKGSDDLAPRYADDERKESSPSNSNDSNYAKLVNDNFIEQNLREQQYLEQQEEEEESYRQRQQEVRYASY